MSSIYEASKMRVIYTYTQKVYKTIKYWKKQSVEPFKIDCKVNSASVILCVNIYIYIYI